MIKIFHTGDNHLDSPFFRLSLSKREAERAHQRDIFAKMMSFVKENKYDLVLISGDLLDFPSVSPETADEVVRAFSSLDCPVVISPGNHDPYLKTPLYSQGQLPDNVYVFNSNELQIFEFEELGVEVCGYAFMKDNVFLPPLKELALPKTDKCRILCAHADLNASSSVYAPISDSDIERLGFTYAALGHLHKAVEPYRKGASLIGYCGFPEGRAFDEEGDGGALSVTIDKGKAVAERVVFSEKRYVYDSVSIESCLSDADTENRIRILLSEKGYGKETALRLSLEGMIDIDYVPDQKLLTRVIEPLLMKLSITDNTYPEIDLSSLENDFTLRGEIYRTLKNDILSSDESLRKKATEALRVALLAIDGRNISL